MKWHHVFFGAVVLVATSVVAAAQPSISAPYEPTLRCTSLSFFGGVATSESDAGGLLGGTAGWQISPRFGLEGNAFWLDRPGNETGFSAAFNSHVNLLARRRAVPFLAAGIGVYRASLDAEAAAASEFHRERFAAGDALATKQTFTDPAFIVGGGVDFFLSPQLALRPQGDVMFVVNDGKSRMVPMFTVHLAYHFHEHPITPSRR
jgi:opacity protein-like surface antigen